MFFFKHPSFPFPAVLNKTLLQLIGCYPITTLATKWGGAPDPVQNVVHMMAQMSEVDSPGHKICFYTNGQRFTQLFPNKRIR